MTFHSFVAASTTTMSFSPRGCVLYSYVPGWRILFSRERRVETEPSGCASLYRVGEGCCEEAKFAFPWRVSTPICNALKRRIFRRKKKPASDAPIPSFFPLFLFAEREKIMSAVFLARFTRWLTEQYRVMHGGRNSTVSL